MQYTDNLRPLTMKEIAEKAEECSAYRIYLHWSAGHYGHAYEDYHLNIDYDGKIYACDNDLDFDEYKEHTWLRNSNAIGIALLGCWDAQANNGYNCDFGSEPPTQAQIEAMASVVATICKHGCIEIDNVQTHCEAAFEDNYGPYSGDPQTRWDLWYLPDYDGEMRIGGDVIRGKARFYYDHM